MYIWTLCLHEKCMIIGRTWDEFTDMIDGWNEYLVQNDYRLVIWGMHGIYGAGRSVDEAFGLIETVEKAAQIYMLTAHMPRINTIKDSEMQELAEFFGVKYRKDFLNL